MVAAAARDARSLGTCESLSSLMGSNDWPCSPRAAATVCLAEAAPPATPGAATLAVATGLRTERQGPSSQAAAPALLARAAGRCPARRRTSSSLNRPSLSAAATLRRPLAQTADAEAKSGTGADRRCTPATSSSRGSRMCFCDDPSPLLAWRRLVSSTSPSMRRRWCSSTAAAPNAGAGLECLRSRSHSAYVIRFAARASSSPDSCAAGSIRSSSHHLVSCWPSEAAPARGSSLAPHQSAALAPPFRPPDHPVLCVCCHVSSAS
mmetsp:Transcript_15090/g.42901  ORF Transcript_15090/g.42901 Transcript_15090/m.42901 type:complete len:264 (+) Transcript_15090:779-1570(+)